MAGETEEHLDDSASLREDAIVMALPDGRMAIMGSDNGWYLPGKDGHPDMEQPVDIYKEFNLERPPDRSP